MKLTTVVELPEYPFRIDHRMPVLLTGSCFTENVGNYLQRYLFPVCINPFGVTYNPLSVLQGIRNLAGKEAYGPGDLDQHGGMWFSFDHYTRFSDPDRDRALKKINQRFNEAKDLFRAAGLLVITWGTAWVYEHRGSERIVNNCHKIPAREFNRFRLTPEQVAGAYVPFLDTLFSERPDLNILFTVSPVRHWKDGARGNQLSKAVLILATEMLVEQYPGRCFYFPSYEIVMDELRDYRFYGPDLLHTSDTASAVIWEKFRDSLVSESAVKVITELEPLIRLMEHRPFTTRGDAYLLLKEKRASLEGTLREKYPHLAWSNLDNIR